MSSIETQYLLIVQNEVILTGATVWFSEDWHGHDFLDSYCCVFAKSCCHTPTLNHSWLGQWRDLRQGLVQPLKCVKQTLSSLLVPGRGGGRARPRNKMTQDQRSSPQSSYGREVQEPFSNLPSNVNWQASLEMPTQSPEGPFVRRRKLIWNCHCGFHSV